VNAVQVPAHLGGPRYSAIKQTADKTLEKKLKTKAEIAKSNKQDKTEI